MGRFESYPATDTLNDDDITLYNHSNATNKVTFSNLVTLIKNKLESMGLISIGTGIGLSGGTITSSGVIKCNLKSETPSTYNSTISTMLNRQYAVGVDSEGYLSVNVPWEINSYQSGSGITLVNNTIGVDYTNVMKVDGSNAASEVTFSGAFTVGSRATNSVVGTNSVAEGGNSTASGDYSHAEGYLTVASGYGSHAEGCRGTGLTDYKIISSGDGSHAEGYASHGNTEASGKGSHAEGLSTGAHGQGSHAEGSGTTTSGTGSHAEGTNTTAGAMAAHAEGSDTKARSLASHAEGGYTVTSGDYSHAEGYHTTTQGNYSHSEGQFTQTIGKSSHSEGYSSGKTINLGDNSPSDYDSTVTIPLTAIGDGSHVEGYVDAINNDSTIYIGSIQAKGKGAHAEGYSSGYHSSYYNTNYAYVISAYGDGSHAEGYATNGNIIAKGNGAHAEGMQTNALGDGAHAEGYNTQSGGYSGTHTGCHAEGDSTIAEGIGSHAEGWFTKAYTTSHAEGGNTYATQYAHSEGYYTYASYYNGDTDYSHFGSHAEGHCTYAKGSSHAEGHGRNYDFDFTRIEGTQPSEYQGANRQISAVGIGSHAEGCADGTSGPYVDVPFYIGNIQASGTGSHAEGYAQGGTSSTFIIASGNGSHAEGYATQNTEPIIASGDGSHAEGGGSTASGDYSHAEGYGTHAEGDYSHAGGYNVVAERLSQFVQGGYNDKFGVSTNGKGVFGFQPDGVYYTIDTVLTNSQNGCSGTVNNASITLQLSNCALYLLFVVTYNYDDSLEILYTISTPKSTSGTPHVTEFDQSVINVNALSNNKISLTDSGEFMFSLIRIM